MRRVTPSLDEISPTRRSLLFPDILVWSVLTLSYSGSLLSLGRGDHGTPELDSGTETPNVLSRSGLWVRTDVFPQRRAKGGLLKVLRLTTR